MAKKMADDVCRIFDKEERDRIKCRFCKVSGFYSQRELSDHIAVAHNGEWRKIKEFLAQVSIYQGQE